MRRRFLVFGALAVTWLLFFTAVSSWAVEYTLIPKKGSSGGEFNKIMRKANDGDVIRFEAGEFKLGNQKVTKRVAIQGTVDLLTGEPLTTLTMGSFNFTTDRRTKSSSANSTVTGLKFKGNKPIKGNVNGITISKNEFEFSRPGKAIDLTQVSGWIIDGNTFTNVDFPVYGRAVDNTVVTENIMTNAVQFISNWDGSGWTITNNTLSNLRTAGGGGIGILIGSNDGIAGGASGNSIEGNAIGGTLTRKSVAVEKYVGAGIALVAAPKGKKEPLIKANTVALNTVNIFDDDFPPVVDNKYAVCGIILNIIVKKIPNPLPCFITNNNIESDNILDAMTLQIAQKPEGIFSTCNNGPTLPVGVFTAAGMDYSPELAGSLAPF